MPATSAETTTPPAPTASTGRPSYTTESPLTVEAVARPELGSGEVLVQVEASGLCHTDIHAAHGDWPVKQSPPFIRHEGVGIVVEAGRTSSRWRRAIASRCPGSPMPAAAATTVSPAGRRSASTNRTWATRSMAASGSTPKAYGNYVVKVPDGIDPFDAAPLTCAGVTTYKAVKVAGTRLVTWWQCSASAGSVTWRSSTRRSRAGA